MRLLRFGVVVILAFLTPLTEWQVASWPGLRRADAAFSRCIGSTSVQGFLLHSRFICIMVAFNNGALQTGVLLPTLKG